MSDALKWLIRNCPNLVTLLAGVWIAFLSLWFEFSFGGCTITSSMMSRDLESLGYYLHSLPGAGLAEFILFITGVCTAATGVVGMVLERWFRRPYAPPIRERVT